MSLGWFTLPLVSIDDIELLVDLSVSGVGNDVSVFIINSTLDIEDLLLLIGNLKTSSVPHLPPSRVWCGHSEGLRFTVRADFNGSVLPVPALDGLGFTFEDPLLCLSVLIPSLVSEISIAYAFDNSSHWHS